MWLAVFGYWDGAVAKVVSGKGTSLSSMVVVKLVRLENRLCEGHTATSKRDFFAIFRPALEK